jgi:hypothetical protein
MGYVRFKNTLKDMMDCNLHMDDDGLSAEENTARLVLICMCCDIAINYGHEVERNFLEVSE